MLAFSPSGKLVPVLGWEPEWTVLSGLPFFSVRHGLRVVALHGSADPTIGGAVLFPFAAKLAATSASIAFANCLASFSVGKDFACPAKGARFAISSNGTAVLA